MFCQKCQKAAKVFKKAICSCFKSSYNKRESLGHLQNVEYGSLLIKEMNERAQKEGWDLDRIIEEREEILKILDLYL